MRIFEIHLFPVELVVVWVGTERDCTSTHGKANSENGQQPFNCDGARKNGSQQILICVANHPPMQVSGK